ncbi:MAG: DUF2062 domain-containing protein [Sedimentisphaerales bacterium]|nr:DUF2062 domain-containing protein [Sedimentisphaerales bacterium]
MDEPITLKRKNHKLLRFFEYRILHIDDSPHKIALGFAIGIFVAWTPIFGTRLLLVAFLSILLRANKVVGFISTCISNVFTYIFFCYASYFLGRAVFSIFAPGTRLSKEQLEECLNDIFAPANITAGFFTKDYWHEIWALTKNIGIELWLGSIILGLLTAVVSYFICYKIIKNHRAKIAPQVDAGL